MRTVITLLVLAFTAFTNAHADEKRRRAVPMTLQSEMRFSIPDSDTPVALPDVLLDLVAAQGLRMNAPSSDIDLGADEDTYQRKRPIDGITPSSYWQTLFHVARTYGLCIEFHNDNRLSSDFGTKLDDVAIVLVDRFAVVAAADPERFAGETWLTIACRPSPFSASNVCIDDCSINIGDRAEPISMTESAFAPFGTDSWGHPIKKDWSQSTNQPIVLVGKIRAVAATYAWSIPLDEIANDRDRIYSLGDHATSIRIKNVGVSKNIPFGGYNYGNVSGVPSQAFRITTTTDRPNETLAVFRPTMTPRQASLLPKDSTVIEIAASISSVRGNLGTSTELEHVIVQQRDTADKLDTLVLDKPKAFSADAKPRLIVTAGELVEIPFEINVTDLIREATPASE